jgi:ribosome-associated protein
VSADGREVREIEIRGEMIRLGQLLKLAGLVGSGAESKLLLGDGGVCVNGASEARRGRQLNPGDVVAAGGELLRVIERRGRAGEGHEVWPADGRG